VPNHLAKTWPVARIFLFVVLIIIALPVIAFLVNSFLDRRAGNAFEKVQMGMRRPQVVVLLGEPSVTRGCGENLWWGNDGSYRGKNDGRCVSEERYEYFLSAWAIGYSQDGRVVSKYHYFSE
jgi:hypothetical protein